MNANVHTVIESTSLYFTDGKSDKVYHAQLVQTELGYLVNFQYGRRNSTLTAGSKTPAPVDYTAAKKKFDAVVKEKTSKGYSPCESGAAYQGTEKAGLNSDFRPQLLNVVSEAEAIRMLSDPHYGMQPKYDGERRAADINGQAEVTGMNRKGLVVPLPMGIKEEMFSLFGELGAFRVDAEIIGDTLYVFDLLIVRSQSIRHLTWLERMQIAENALAGCKYLKVSPTALSYEEKLAMFNRIKREHGEGVVYKLLDAESTEGRPNALGAWLKFKFVESATCIVSAIHATKRSVSIQLLNEAGELVNVGNATIPANKEIPKPLSLVEVAYLYAYQGGSLYQPVYLGERTDLDVSACTLKQLKYKPEGTYGDDEDDES